MFASSKEFSNVKKTIDTFNSLFRVHNFQEP